VLAGVPQHAAEGLDPFARAGAGHDAEAEVPAGGGDQAAVGVLADEDPDVAPAVVAGRRQQVLVPEGVGVAALQVGPAGGGVGSQRAVAVAQGADPQAHGPGDQEPRQLDQEGVTNLHAWASMPSRMSNDE